MREQDERGKLQLAEQRAERRAEQCEKVEIAKNLKNTGLPITDISKATGLTEADIERM